MYPLPAPLAAVLASTTYQAVARLVSRWPDGSLRRAWELGDQLVATGTVTADLARDARRSAQLELANASGALSPAALGDPFAEGSWLAVERGGLVEGTPVYVPLINGFVTACRPTMRGSLSVSVESFLSACAQPAGTALVLRAGTYVGDALQTLWSPVLPFVSWSIDDGGRALGSDIPVLPGDDRLAVGLTLARDSGLEAFDDRLGRVVIRPRQDASALPTARTFTTPIDLAREVSRRPYNAQPLEASPGTGEPFFVVATVDDPASPIHPDRIGLRMAPVIRSDTTADPDTAMAAARAALERLALSQDGVSSTEVPVLDIDEGDVCAWAERITGAVGRYRVSSITVPVTTGAASITATRVVPLWAA